MGKMKKYISTILVIFLAATLLPLTAMAEEIPQPEEVAIEEALAEEAAAEEIVVEEAALEEEVFLAEEGRPYVYKVVDGTAHITSYYGIATDLIVPDTLDDYPVTCIAKNAFRYKTFNSITLPSTLRTIEESAF